MIISVRKAVLHILDANSGITVYSNTELDTSEGMINAFITGHIDKVMEDGSLRKGEFKESSGFKQRLEEYIENKDIVSFSQFIAHRVYDGISNASETESCDIMVCDCIANDNPIIAVLKFDNKIGYTHQVHQDGDEIRNNLINHYAILPMPTQKVAECAFIYTNDFSVKYKGKKRVIDGEKMDLFADIVLEGIFDLSAREAISKVKRIAKNVTESNGGDSIEINAKMKQYIVENIEENDFEFVETQKIAETVFDGRPVMKQEFIEKLDKEEVPQKVEVTHQVTKRLSSNVKIVTDTGIEISFPAEFYKDNENIEIINNEDGKISIKINNVGEIINKSR